MEKNLVLTFNTRDNKEYKVTIKNPKDDITKNTADEVATKIIETNVFNNTKRTLNSLKKVAYVTKQENIIE